MPPPNWKLFGTAAELVAEPLRAHLDLTDLRAGLSRVQFAHREAAGHCLALRATHGSIHSAAGSLHDSYLRRDALSASYLPQDAAQWQLHFDWRLPTGTDPDTRDYVRCAIDLVISVQTNLWEAYPQFALHTQWANAPSTLWTIDAADHAVQQPHPRSTELSQTPTATAHKTVVSWQGVGQGDNSHQKSCYLEMAYPGDFVGADPAGKPGSSTNDVHPDACQPPQTAWSWLYPGHFQEKGVIRRLRVRAVWLEGPCTPKRIAACWRDFVAQELPLTA